jgi:hypothetical protein
MRKNGTVNPGHAEFRQMFAKAGLKYLKQQDNCVLSDKNEHSAEIIGRSF